MIAAPLCLLILLSPLLQASKNQKRKSMGALPRVIKSMDVDTPPSVRRDPPSPIINNGSNQLKMKQQWEESKDDDSSDAEHDGMLLSLSEMLRTEPIIGSKPVSDSDEDVSRADKVVSRKSRVVASAPPKSDKNFLQDGLDEGHSALTATLSSRSTPPLERRTKEKEREREKEKERELEKKVKNSPRLKRTAKPSKKADDGPTIAADAKRLDKKTQKERKISKKAKSVEKEKGKSDEKENSPSPFSSSSSSGSDGLPTRNSQSDSSPKGSSEGTSKKESKKPAKLQKIKSESSLPTKSKITGQAKKASPPPIHQEPARIRTIAADFMIQIMLGVVVDNENEDADEILIRTNWIIEPNTLKLLSLLYKAAQEHLKGSSSSSAADIYRNMALLVGSHLQQHSDEIKAKVVEFDDLLSPLLEFTATPLIQLYEAHVVSLAYNLDAIRPHVTGFSSSSSSTTTTTSSTMATTAVSAESECMVILTRASKSSGGGKAKKVLTSEAEAVALVPLFVELGMTPISLTISPNELAVGLTSFMWILLRQVGMGELLTEKVEKSPNKQQFSLFMDRLTGWIMQMILAYESAEGRQKMIEIMLSLGEALLDNHNYAGLMAVITALISSPISRLRNSWMPSLLRKLTMLNEEMTNERLTFVPYHKLVADLMASQASGNNAFIPFLSRTGAEIIRLQSVAENSGWDAPQKDGLINLSLLLDLWKAVEPVKIAQERPSNQLSLTTCYPVLLSLLDAPLPPMNKLMDLLYDLSVKLEPFKQ